MHTQSVTVDEATRIGIAAPALVVFEGNTTPPVDFPNVLMARAYLVEAKEPGKSFRHARIWMLIDATWTEVR